VLGADARVRAAEADGADEPLVLAARGDPRAPLPRARPGRPVRLPLGDGARGRARPPERRDVHRGHRRREPGSGLHPRPACARLRGPDGRLVLLPRHAGVRPGRTGRAGHLLGRPTREAPLEHRLAAALRARPRRVLITGAGGQLGTALQEVFPDARALTRADWDVTRPFDQVKQCYLVLHAAAWTDVDGAEADPAGAEAVNVTGTRNVVSLGAPVVYFSTDYVFDGAKREPYIESDEPNPLSVYGRTKLAGEREVLEGWIVRSSWLFGSSGRNFVRTMLDLARRQDEVAVVADQVGCPTYAGHLAEVTKELLELRHGV